MIKLFICPECQWLRVVSRRAKVECFKCGRPQMEPVKLTYSRYMRMNPKQREDYIKSWIYIYERTKKQKNLKN